MIAMVSSIRTLHSSGYRKCNLNAVLCRCIAVLTFAIWLAFFPRGAAAQVAATSAAGSDGISVTDTVKFLSGSALALVMHEGGHLLMDGIFGADPKIKGVKFGPFPFFAITHPQLSPRREFAVSSAGFWVQN